MTRRSSSLTAIGCAGVLLGTSACASGGDAVSRQLVAITHSVAMAGSLGVSDDGSYSFIDSTARKETRGRLAAEELANLKARVAQPRLSQLYSFRADDDACTTVTDSYFIQSQLGTACFVGSSITDPAARGDFDFLSALYRSKSGAK